MDFLRESNEFDDASSLVCESIFSLFLRFFKDDELSDTDDMDFDTGVFILDLLEDKSYHSFKLFAHIKYLLNKLRIKLFNRMK